MKTTTDGLPHLPIEMVDKIFSFLLPFKFDWSDTAVKFQAKLYEPIIRDLSAAQQDDHYFEEIFIRQGLFNGD